MPAAISLITLLTDFGERDYFVASMKGVILNINPQARIVDLSHQVGPQQVEEAAYLLKSCYRYFPDGTVHVVVVDPGVGSARRPLLVTSSRYYFVAPDNGVLTDIFQEELSVEVREIENKQYRLDAEGATFDGRDLFAPAAAWLTRGQPPGSYGRLIRDYVRLPSQEPAWEGQALVG
ncbi:MAG: SAM hydrolase/SAM-dependent halogenase family protein, partial [Candidatus Methylomirabilales bacterium]